MSSVIFNHRMAQATTLQCAGKILPAPSNELQSAGNELIEKCKSSQRKCEEITAAGGGATAAKGVNATEATKDADAGKKAAGTQANLAGYTAMVAAEAKKACDLQRAKVLSYIGSDYKLASKNLFESINTAAAQKDEAANAETCNEQALRFDKEVKSELNPCLAIINKIAIENGMTSNAAMQAAQESSGIADMLSSDTGKMLGAGALGAALGAGAMHFLNKDKDKDDDDDDNSNFTVNENADGGYCVKYGKDQEKCYDNTQLSQMCFTSSETKQASYPYPNVMQNAQTDKIKEALCTSFKADTRDGGGGDTKTCFTNKAEYFKEQACQSRMLTQCQNTDFGDCAKFNDHYCYNDDQGEGKGTNYCVYREAKSFCEGGGSPSSPSCTWIKQMADLGTNGDSSCMANINQATCFPNAYGSGEHMGTACTNLGIADKDPLCKNLNNPKTYFSWRNPGSPGSESVASLGSGGLTPLNTTKVVPANACIKPDMDCTLPKNRSAASCVDYYCCNSKNAAAPICQSLTIATAPSLTNSSKKLGSNMANSNYRYPAGSLPADVQTYRTESIFTSSGNSAVKQLCAKGELYDCGSLSGYIPK
ncbi:MAG: hypothetical protein H6625_09710 [Bdellovibrionaceae bacterium]|nr:hypothetical protein [Pseudobdellovibrionaceae bacterium]